MNTFCDMELNGKSGFGDGVRCDEQGNVWVGAGWFGKGYDGVHVFAPDGQRFGQTHLPRSAPTFALVAQGGISCS